MPLQVKCFTFCGVPGVSSLCLKENTIMKYWVFQERFCYLLHNSASDFVKEEVKYKQARTRAHTKAFLSAKPWLALVGADLTRSWTLEWSASSSSRWRKVLSFLVCNKEWETAAERRRPRKRPKYLNSLICSTNCKDDEREGGQTASEQLWRLFAPHYFVQTTFPLV